MGLINQIEITIKEKKTFIKKIITKIYEKFIEIIIINKSLKLVL